MNDPLTWLKWYLWFCGWDHLDADELIKDPTIASYAEDGAQIDPKEEKALFNLSICIQDYLGLQP